MRLSRRRIRVFVRQLPARLTAQRQRLMAAAILGVALLSLSIIWASARPTAKAPKPSSTPVVITHSTDKPAENKPDPATYHWAGQPATPKYLRLPTIQAEGFIQQVDVDQHKAIAVPTNIHLAGWFVQSRLPGAQGLSIIDGHLDGRSGGGIFEHLGQLKPGNQFSITFGDNSTKNFIVRRVQSAPVAETAALLFSQDPAIGQQLNLITCGGTYDQSAHQYDQRIVVMAELVQKK